METCASRAYMVAISRVEQGGYRVWDWSSDRGVAMANDENSALPVWPLWVWALQLAPGVSASWIAVVVIVDRGVAASWLVFALAAGALGWTAGVLGFLFFRGSRRWLARNRREWSLALASLAIAFVAGDFLLNLLGVIPTIEDQRQRSLEYTFYHYAGYRLVPKTVLVDDGDSIEINSRGFRGPELATRPSAGVFRVVFLGGSQVFDYQGGGWPGIAGDRLRKRGLNVEIVNAGVVGHSSTDSAFKLLTDVWTLNPDLVIACHGWNDVKFFVRMNDSAPYREFPPAEPITLYRDWRLHPEGLDQVMTRSSLYRFFRVSLLKLLYTEEGRDISQFYFAPENRLTFDSSGPRQFELNIGMILALTRQIGAQAMLCKQAILEGGVSASGIDAADYAQRNINLSPSERARAFNIVRRVIDDFTSESDVMMLDMHSPMSNKGEYFHDAVHFNKRGSVVAAQLAAEAIALVINTRAARERDLD